MLLLVLSVGRCDHWRCTGGADEGRLLLVLHSRMLCRLLRRRRYQVLLLELPEVEYHDERLLHERCPKVLWQLARFKPHPLAQSDPVVAATLDNSC